MVPRWTRFKASLSHVINVVFNDGREDEMLSSYAYRIGNAKLIAWLDWWFGAGHCSECYYWELERRESYQGKTDD